MDNAPNLDAMSVDELWAFARRHTYGHNSTEMFPERRRKERREAVRLLDLYAWWKLFAVQDRLAGNIESAMTSEAKADDIYKQLPAWARW